MEPVPKFCLQLAVGSRVLELESVLGSSLLPFSASLLAAPFHHEFQLVCLPASLEHAGWYFALLLFVVGAAFTLLKCCIQHYYRTVHVKQLVERNSEPRTGSSLVQGSRGPVGGATLLHERARSRSSSPPVTPKRSHFSPEPADETPPAYRRLGCFFLRTFGLGRFARKAGASFGGTGLVPGCDDWRCEPWSEDNILDWRPCHECSGVLEQTLLRLRHPEREGDERFASEIYDLCPEWSTMAGHEVWTKVAGCVDSVGLALSMKNLMKSRLWGL